MGCAAARWSAVVSCLALLLGACRAEVGTEGGFVLEDSLAAMPQQWAERIEVALLDSVQVRARISAQRAAALPELQQTRLWGSVRVYLLRNGAPVGELSADSAHIDERSGLMSAYGSVRAYSYENRTVLYSSELVWDRAQQRFFSMRPVRIESPTEVVEGVGFEADQALRHYRVFNVRGRRP
ncbi:MAG: LPS export ABC transporter periplasmic protein LptC [Chlorobiota bacterium]|nr:LPS export ABC transporter periplasmic protein LptC [Chlorobiota bacterium]